MTTTTAQPPAGSRRRSRIVSGIASVVAGECVYVSHEDFKESGLPAQVVAMVGESSCLLGFRHREGSGMDRVAVAMPRPKRNPCAHRIACGTELAQLGITKGQSLRVPVRVARGLIVIDFSATKQTRRLNVQPSRPAKAREHMSHPPIPGDDVRRQCRIANPYTPPSDIWRLAWQQRHLSASSFAPAWQPIIRAAQALAAQRKESR